MPTDEPCTKHGRYPCWDCMKDQPVFVMKQAAIWYSEHAPDPADPEHYFTWGCDDCGASDLFAYLDRAEA